MGHLPVNNEFDTALGPCQNHYSPVNEEGATERGGSIILGEAIIRPARVCAWAGQTHYLPHHLIYIFCPINIKYS